MRKKDQDNKTCVLKALKGMPMYWTELKEATGLSDQTLTNTLTSLINDNLVVHPGRGSKYACVEDIDLLGKYIAQKMRKQIIIKLIDRMRAKEPEKADNAARARSAFIDLCLVAEKATEAVREQKIMEELTAIDKTGKQLYSPEGAKEMYETYHRKSEERMRQEAEKLADRLEDEEGEELKKKVASTLAKFTQLSLKPP